jgi:hypothetical protein
MPANMKTEILNEKQLASLLKVLNEETDQDAADILRLALFTGARRGEILKLRWDDIDLARGVWILRDRKDGRDTGFPISTVAREVLSNRLAMRGDSPFVFPGTGKDGYLGNHPAAFKRIKPPRNYRKRKEWRNPLPRKANSRRALVYKRQTLMPLPRPLPIYSPSRITIFKSFRFFVAAIANGDLDDLCVPKL